VLRLPAVAGRFYSADPPELTAQILRYASREPHVKSVKAKACLVPHAGYMYSGHVAGAVYSHLALPKKIVILGVRHFPRGASAAILSSGAWRTPLGDTAIDEPLAQAIAKACPILKEDSVAHSAEHSIEVQLPFLQLLTPAFSFVPIALGTIRLEELVSVGQGLGQVLANDTEEVFLLTTSDLNHYEDDATTRDKDAKVIDRLLAFDGRGLYDVCRNQEISMCGLGPAVAMLTALSALGPTEAELIRYATSGDISGDRSAVVGYAGIIFR
jgi:MEMO1 family protein